MNASGFIADGSEWTFDALEAYEREISRLADSYRLDTYPNQIEIISAEQMIDAYSSTGMPVGYHHWSFGKQFLSTQQLYSARPHGARLRALSSIRIRASPT